MIARSETGALNCVLQLTIDTAVQPSAETMTEQLRQALAVRCVPEIIFFVIPRSMTVDPRRIAEIERAARAAVNELHPVLRYAHLHLALAGPVKTVYQPLYRALRGA